MNNNNEDFNKKNFKTPVSWLMGRELLAGLKWIMAYSFMGDKLDAKDWMNAEIITPPRSNNNAIDPYWFDYIADTGDGMSAVYNIAYLCMSELWVDTQSTLGPNSVALAADAACTQHLPRGEFLFVGGDTAYHIADSASLRERFQTPFNCAAIDIMRSGKSVDQRPIYGVPANHDYYDALDGFNRQFCKPIGQDTHNPLLNDQKDPQLGLLGYERTQTASYVALRLPFDWWLWGLDSQEGKMDKRQRAFFVSTFYPKALDDGELFDADLRSKVFQELLENVPAKLIVTTPEPSTVFGRWAKLKNPEDPEDGIVKTFKSLGIEPCFLQDNDGKLRKDKCRLDISGDIHHYERYWGARPNDKMPANYASVVAGGGGAFLHPSHTDINEVEKQSVYPCRKDSHVLVTQKILNPLNIFLGGYIWLAGGIISFMSYFAATIPHSTWSLFKLIPNELRPNGTSDNLLPQIKAALDISKGLNNPLCCDSTYYFDLAYISLFIGLLGYWLWKTPNHFAPVKNTKDPNLWRRTLLFFIVPIIVGSLPLFMLTKWNRDQLPESFLSGLLIDFFFIAALLLFGLSRRYSDILIKRAKIQREPLSSLLPLWVLNWFAAIFAVFGFFRYGAYSTSVMTFNLIIVIIWFLSSFGLIFLAFYEGGKLANIRGKIKFAAIGIWHALLQISVPVGLVLYSDWPTILIISTVTAAVTFIAGKFFTLDFVVKDLSLENQKTIGYLLMASWLIVGICSLFALKSGDPIAVDGWRLLTAFMLGAWFSCIWFGWYLAVSLAFHGHNNEAGGGTRSEQYRHMIRFKLMENSLTGYVIGVDKPMTDLSAKGNEQPKFRLVDVFTIQLPRS